MVFSLGVDIVVSLLHSTWGAVYPTNAHERRGKEVGLPAAVVEAIVAGRPAVLQDAREGVVYDVALALAGGRLIPQDLYDQAIKALGHEGITDLIVLLGYYTCVSLTMNFYAVPASGSGTPRHELSGGIRRPGAARSGCPGNWWLARQAGRSPASTCDFHGRWWPHCIMALTRGKRYGV